MATCEVDWLHKLLTNLCVDVTHKVVIYSDNLSSIQLERNLLFHARTKHIEVHYHFIWECVLAGSIDLVYIGTNEQVADIFTKALGAEKFCRFWTMLGIQDMELILRGSVEMSSSS